MDEFVLTPKVRRKTAVPLGLVEPGSRVVENDSRQAPRRALRRWILDHFGLPIRAFDRAVADGYIRSAKFGETRQSARVFLVQDCERYKMALAAGRKPMRTIGRIR